jgi:hypothetical protein
MHTVELACNYAFCVVFVFELVVLIFAHGWAFLFNVLWVLDGLMVLGSVGEVVANIVVGSPATGKLSVLRTIRLLRVLRIAEQWTSLALVLDTLQTSARSAAASTSAACLRHWRCHARFASARVFLSGAQRTARPCSSALPLLIMLCIFIWMFAIIGMELFGGTLKRQTRSNFDSMWPGSFSCECGSVTAFPCNAAVSGRAGASGSLAQPSAQTFSVKPRLDAARCHAGNYGYGAVVTVFQVRRPLCCMRCPFRMASVCEEEIERTALIRTVPLQRAFSSAANLELVGLPCVRCSQARIGMR